MANLIVSGQMIRNGRSPGPMFQIYTNSEIGEGPYHARCISQLTGCVLVASDDSPSEIGMNAPGNAKHKKGFKTIGEAMEWCHEYIDW